MTNELPRCATCKHWTRNNITQSVYKTVNTFGDCSRWAKGYGISLDRLASNEVVVEDDEGWGATTGESFGCVLHEIAN